MFRQTFTTPFDQYAEREGQKFVVLKELDETDGIDLECLPMWRIQFDDGFVTEAWPEEILLDA